MPGTKIVNERMYAVIEEGVQYYVLQYNCIFTGTGPTPTPLPDTGVFLYEIVDPADADTDLFTRVVDIGDFSEYANSRATALLNGDNFWRSADAYKRYSDFNVALAAKSAFHDRLDTLVTDYENYSVDFVTPPAGDDIYYPQGTTPSTTIDQLADAYYTAYEDYLLAIDGPSPTYTGGWMDKLAAYNAANADVAVKASLLSASEWAAAALDYACDHYSAFVGPTDGVSNAAWYYGVTGCAAAPDRAAFAARRALEVTYAGVVCADSGTAAGNVTAAQNAYNGSLSTRTTKYTDLRSLNDQIKTLNTAVGTAYTALTSACPTFVEPRGYEFASLPAVPTMPALP